MKRTRSIKQNHKAHCTGLLAVCIAAAGTTISNAETKVVTDLLGNKRFIYDSDGDGWDDLWCAIFRDLKHRNKTTDTDGDGISDYDEMLLWRDPMVEGPPPRKLTPEEIEEARKRAEEAATKALAEKRERLKEKIEAGRQVALRANQPRPALILPAKAAKREALAKMGQELLGKQTAEFQRVRNAPMDERLRKALTPEHGLVPVGGKAGQLSVLGTDNLVAADTIAIDELWPGGASPLPDLSGAGRVVGVWEAGGGVLAAHDEFQAGGNSRVIQVDDPADSDLPDAHNHATQVAGTIAASGFVGASQGGAFASDINAYDSVGDIGEMAIAVSQGLEISNHSYSLRAGWMPVSGWGWVWIGRNIAGEDPQFGIYTELSRQIDLLVYESDTYLPVFSSSNEVANAGPVDFNTGLIPNGQFYWWFADTDGDGIPDTPSFVNTAHPPDGGNPLPGATSPVPGSWPPLGVGFDTVKPRACAKNNLAVGAISDVVGGIQNATNAQMAFFSSHGPTDDGRIKPDLVANGTDVVTTDFDADNDTLTDRYTDGVNGDDPVSGTSFSTPSVTGAIALLQEFNETLGGSPPWASSLKAVMLHTADDATDLPGFTGLGAVNFVGPDYFYGWGSANAESAATLVRNNHATQSGRTHLREHVLFDGNTIDIPVQWDGSSGEMRFTIVWTDPAFQDIAVASAEEGVPVVDDNTVVDDPTLRLINDLDLRVIAPGGGTTLQPWRLDPANPATPATTGDNTRDNVEQVVVSAPVAGTYTVRVSHKGSLSIAQAIQPGHPQYDPNVTRYELTGGQHQRFSLALSGNAELPGDRLVITSIDRIGNDSLLEWQSVPGIRYQVETSADLQIWSDVGGAVDATLTLTPFLTTEPSGTDRKFYRVREVGM